MNEKEAKRLCALRELVRETFAQTLMIRTDTISDTADFFDELGGVSASVVGAALGRAALSKSRKVFCTVGFVYRLVIFLMRLLPSTAANAILGKMYAE